MYDKLLIANRGEIAVRLVRAAREAGISTVAVHARDDADAMHVALADASVALDAFGPSAYLDPSAILTAAKSSGCGAIHPGYGFLSERADFAEACATAGVVFVGPSAPALALFGDKARARGFARDHGVPTLEGSLGTSLSEIEAFFARERDDDPRCAIVLKAVYGGGGRGMRVVRDPAQLHEAFAHASAEARAAFGADAVYAERFIPRARHVEVQVVGDGAEVVVLGDRDCTLQRRFQKLVEIAPAPRLSPALRQALADAATTLARASRYRSLGTFEFLVDESSEAHPFVFIEANPRLQVEHTITEEVTGLDLVRIQLAIARGASLASLDLRSDRTPTPIGHAIEWRINAETTDAEGRTRPSSGTIDRLDLPTGRGIRIDTHARSGSTVSPHYDSLLAKLVVHHESHDLAEVVGRSAHALAELRIDGVETNLPLLRAIASDDAFRALDIHTRFLEERHAELASHAERFRDTPSSRPPPSRPSPAAEPSLADGLVPLVAPMAGRVVAIHVDEGGSVGPGDEAVILEAMKMHHVVGVSRRSRVDAVRVRVGEVVDEGRILLALEPMPETTDERGAEDRTIDPTIVRGDLQRVLDRSAFTLDAARPDEVEKRHASGGRTARENIADLCDEGSFREYGAFAIAAQTRRRSLDDLIRRTPADGMVTGIGTVNAAWFGPTRSRTAVMAYDYTVLAGTQGWRNHRKKDRLLGVAHEHRLPVVLYAEGGGGRPGDVDVSIVAGLDNHTFRQFAALSGKVPVIGIVHGRCFAGNAALLGCSDVIIATESSNIGMGGPAMIEGGGLGVYRPEDIGPAAELRKNGVIDVLVRDEAEATSVAKKLLSYFQGRRAEFTSGDPNRLRRAVPEDRLRAYDMRTLLGQLFDDDSVLELGRDFGPAMITALARIEGRPVGVYANDPRHLGGAIDPDAAIKATRLMELCDAHGLPIVSICDTPGLMVGPEVERRAQVRHASRMFIAASRLRVPCFTVVVRKGYGLGAQAMAASGFDAPVFTVSWPTGEFGGMGIEGAVRLGYRKELEAAAEGPARDALFEQLVAKQYESGSAINMATSLEIDAVIDPRDTRAWLVSGLDATERGAG